MLLRLIHGGPHNIYHEVELDQAKPSKMSQKDATMFRGILSTIDLLSTSPIITLWIKYSVLYRKLYFTCYSIEEKPRY